MAGAGGIHRDVYPQPILGWREWAIARDSGGSLALWPLFDHSLTPIPWSCDPSEPASCVIPDHRSPEHDCTCGWHAWFSPEKMHAWRPWRSENPYEVAVAGAIAGAGRIELHRDGFRCERAQVLCLVLGGSSRERKMQREVAERVSVPLFRSRRRAKRYARGLCPSSPAIELPEFEESATARASDDLRLTD